MNIMKGAFVREIDAIMHDIHNPLFLMLFLYAILITH